MIGLAGVKRNRKPAGRAGKSLLPKQQALHFAQRRSAKPRDPSVDTHDREGRDAEVAQLPPRATPQEVDLHDGNFFTILFSDGIGQVFDCKRSARETVGERRGLLSTMRAHDTREEAEMRILTSGYRLGAASGTASSAALALRSDFCGATTPLARARLLFGRHPATPARVASASAAAAPIPATTSTTSSPFRIVMLSSRWDTFAFELDVSADSISRRFEARVRPSLRGLSAPTARHAAQALEALGLPATRGAKVLVLHSLVLFNALVKFFDAWKATGGRTVKEKKWVEGFGAIQELHDLIEERGLEVRMGALRGAPKKRT